MLRRTTGSGVFDAIEVVDDAETFEANYTVKRHIGAGASGRVSLVEHKRLRHKCVLKKIPMRSMKDAAPIMKEVHVLSQLSHPNITRYFGSWHAEGSLNILMEYADNGSLADALRVRADDGDGPDYYDEDAVMDYFIQIVRAVQYIHERHIVHRDLKAQNVLLTKRGIIKVCDFGIAKVLEDTSGGSPGFASTCIGTPYYLSPEIVEDKKYGLPTDIWSLGVLLYEMAALKKPFEANSLPALAMRITKAEYEPLPDNFTQELRGFVGRLLQKDPGLRPTATQVTLDPLFVEHEERFEAELTGTVQDIVARTESARASIASPPWAGKQAGPLLSPPAAPASAPAGGAKLAQTAQLAGPPADVALPAAPEEEEAGITPRAPHGAQAGGGAGATMAGEVALAAAGTGAPAATDPGKLPVSGRATIGRSLGVGAARDRSAASAASWAQPSRGVSLPPLPSAQSPALGAPRGLMNRGSVGHLLQAPAESPQQERALACALRHEIAMESTGASTHARGVRADSAVRASIEENVLFSLNMQALEHAAASVCGDESPASGVNALAGEEVAIAAGQDESSSAPPRASQSPQAVTVSHELDHDTPVVPEEWGMEGEADETAAHARPSLLSPEILGKPGFVTTRRSRRGDKRSKLRTPVSPALYDQPMGEVDEGAASGENTGEEPRTPLQEHNFTTSDVVAEKESHAPSTPQQPLGTPSPTALLHVATRMDISQQ